MCAFLERRAAGAVRTSDGARELYAVDASLYRRLPAAVLMAREVADLELAVEACRTFGVPLTMRGAGTSLAGQAVGPGLVVDTSGLRALTVDPHTQLAEVEPGVVLDRLNAAAAIHGLAFGPDVATSDRATLGGMIANNSAGARSIVHGVTADHIRSLEVVLADGSRATLSADRLPTAALAASAELASGFTPPALLRRASGYRLDALTGPRPRWQEIVAGSEGTLAVVTRATLDLSPLPRAKGLAINTYPTLWDALEAVPGIVERGPSAVELVDRRMLGEDAGATLIVEFSGDPDTVDAGLALQQGGRVVRDAHEQQAVWAVRRAGVARAMRSAPGDAQPLPFVEDPAVPVEHLARFAREVGRVLDAEDLPAVWFGHASVGCLHIRPMVDLRSPGARTRVRRVAERVADLVAAHGGSLSGEHGDGRVRSELLPRMFDPATIDAFRELKRRLDPDSILNPGVIVDPDRLDEGLRTDVSPPRLAHRTAVSFAAEGGLQRAVESCNGNGACRKDTVAMCPSFQMTGEEAHSTRGRATLLRAALEGRLDGGLANTELHEALDMCLACKACKTECPTGVDMSRLKVEALAHRYREHGTPFLARMFGNAHRLLRAGSRVYPLARAGEAVANRFLSVPVPAPVRAWRPRPRAATGTPIVLMADTFTRFLDPQIGDAAIEVLEACGARVTVVDPGCCGRPAYSEGLVGLARRQATRALDMLAPHAQAGTPIVVLEPSCWSMLTDDNAALLDDPRVATVAAATVTFERAVLDLGLPQSLRRGAGERLVVQPHCHARALGAGDEAIELLRVAGYDAVDSGVGCCGGAGSFTWRHRWRSGQGVDLRTAVAAGTSCRLRGASDGSLAKASCEVVCGT